MALLNDKEILLSANLNLLETISNGDGNVTVITHIDTIYQHINDLPLTAHEEDDGARLLVGDETDLACYQFNWNYETLKGVWEKDCEIKHNTALIVLTGEKKGVYRYSVTPPYFANIDDKSTQGLSYALNEDEDAYSVTGIGSATDSDIVIPAVYNELPVTAIGDSAFYMSKRITSVTIPDSVKSIGKSAFFGCTYLQKVTMGKVITIGDFAFYGCENLARITIPDSLKKISNSMFYGCTRLAHITIPNSVTEIGSRAFIDCTNLKSITIPDSVTTIGYSAFVRCTSLQIVTIPNSVTCIEGSAFFYCENLKRINIPNSVTCIEGEAFRRCTSLTSIAIPESVITIGAKTFSNCTIYCEATAKPEGWDASWDSSNCSVIWGAILDILKVKDSVDTKIGMAELQDAIEDQQGVYTHGLSYGLNLANTEYILSGIGTATDTDIVIPAVYNGLPVTAIGNYAFRNEVDITSVTIPDSITRIGDEAFNACTKLTSVTFSNRLTTIGTESFSGCTSLKSVTIPDSVTTICSSAFRRCTSLENVTIGDNVTTIGSSAFSGCKKLKIVTLGNGIITIDKYAFVNNLSLTHIDIPDSVTSIGDEAFNACANLESVTIPLSVSTIAKNAFMHCPKLTIHCEATEKPEGWDASWNSAEYPVVWGAKLNLSSVNDAIVGLKEYTDNAKSQAIATAQQLAEDAKLEAIQWAQDVKYDLLNGAGEAYDTLKELGDAITENKDVIEVLQETASGKADSVHEHTASDLTDFESVVDERISSKVDKPLQVVESAIQNIESDVDGKLDKSGLPSRLYGTKSDKSQTVYILDKNATANSIPQRDADSDLRVRENPKTANSATSASYVDKQRDNAMAHASGLYSDLNERVSELESLTLSFPKDTSTAYEKQAPIECGKYALINSIGGASEFVTGKNLIIPNTINELYGCELARINQDGSLDITFIPDGNGEYNADFHFSFNQNEGDHYYYYVESDCPEFDVYNTYGGDLAINCYGELGAPTTYNFKVMLYKAEDIDKWTEDELDRSIQEAPEGTVFEPYFEEWRHAKVEKIESLGANLVRIPDISKGDASNQKNVYFDKYIFVSTQTLAKVSSSIWRIQFYYKDGTSQYLTDVQLQNGGSSFKATPENPIIKLEYRSTYITDGAYSGFMVNYGKSVAPYKPFTTEPIDTITIPEDLLNEEGYGREGSSVEFRDDDIYLVVTKDENLQTLATPVEKVITHWFSQDLRNTIEIECGGRLRFVNEYEKPVPSTVGYVIRKE